MVRREEEAAEEHKGLFGRLFGHAKPRQAPQAGTDLELPTGEVLLGADALAKPDGEEPLDLDLTLRTADPGTDFPQPKAEVPAAPEKPAVPDRPAPQPAPENKPEPPKAPAAPAPQPEKPRKKAAQNPKNAPDVLLPQEQQEQQEMQQLKDMLNGMAAKPKPVEETLEPIRSVDVPLDDPEEPETPEKAPEPPRPTMVFAADKPLPEKKSVFRMFGDADDEKKPEVPEEPAAPEKTSPAAPVKAPEAEPETKPDEDTMSLPLEPLDAPETEPTETPVAAPAADTAEVEHAGETELKTEAEDALPAEDEAPESVGEKLRRMSAELTLRCVLAGILAVVLLHVGLVADRLLPPLAALDPDAAPAAFYAANLLLYAASLVVSFPVLRDGLNGLRGRPSAETMPALAAVAALLQAVTALLTANSYRTTEGLSILTGVAALGLFLALLGSRVMLSAVRGGYELLGEATDLQGAYRTRDKDLIRALARDLEQKDPWVLLSRPRTADEGFVAQSLDERAGERRAQKNGYILLGVARPNLVKLMAETLAQSSVHRAAVVCGAGGYDEITPIGPNEMIILDNGELEPLTLDPADYGIPACTPEDLAVSSRDEAVAVLRELLAGRGPEAMRNMLALNVGMSIYLLEGKLPLATCIAKAREALASGVGGRVLHAA